MPQEATGKTGIPSERRTKPERPRDELGRPLDWAAENRLHLEDFDSLSIEENDRLARSYIKAGDHFAAHEAWETAWKKSKGSGDTEFFKGLSQMGAGYVHLLRGNRHGAITLLRRAARRVGAYPAGHRAINTGALRDKLEADARRIERGALIPGPDATFEPPNV